MLEMKKPYEWSHEEKSAILQKTLRELSKEPINNPKFVYFLLTHLMELLEDKTVGRDILKSKKVELEFLIEKWKQ